MKRFILALLLIFGSVSFLYAQDTDRVEVRVTFRKFLWTCPLCGQEDVEDRNMSGGDSYEHTCSKCGAKFNQSGPNMKEYNGCQSYSETEYAEKKVEDIATDKTADFEKWVYDFKHPPEYKEPTAAELTLEIENKQAEIASLEARKVDALAKEEAQIIE